jgi:D-alanyl-D-alanine carboxypeptidase
MSVWPGVWPDPIPQSKPVLFGRAVAVHPKAVLPFQLAEALALQTRYGQLLRSAPDWTWFQTFANRGIRSADPPIHSEHSHSIAVDVRPAFNPMRDDGVFLTDFDRFGIDDGVEFVMAFYRAGFRWGAIWTSPLDHSLTDIEKLVRGAFAKKGQGIRDGRVDTMHFELELSPAQVAARNYAKEIEAAGPTASTAAARRVTTAAAIAAASASHATEDAPPTTTADTEPAEEEEAVTPEEHDLLVQARDNTLFIRRLAEHLDIGVPVEPGEPWADALALRLAELLARAAGEPIAAPGGGGVEPDPADGGGDGGTRGLEDDLEPAGASGGADDREIPTEFEPVGD